MAAGMHFPAIDARMGERVEFRNRQSVHVGAQTHSPVAVSALDDSNHAGLSQAAMDGNIPFSQQLRDQIGGALFLEAEFRMGMDLTPDRSERARVSDNGFDQCHDLPAEKMTAIAKFTHKARNPALSPNSGSWWLTIRHAAITTPTTMPANTAAVLARFQYRPRITPGKN